MANNPLAAEGPSTVENPHTSVEEFVRGRQLIVVSNRQPYRHEVEGGQLTIDRPTGGLTVGLDPVMQRMGGTWIAWGDGDRDAAVVDEDNCVAVPPDEPNYRLKRLWLSEEAVRDYYYGFSNQVLWPVCHSSLTKVRCDQGFWRRYRRVNELFASAAVDHVRDRPLVWFHDYHLALAPRLSRPNLPDDALLMHFWHIPWPHWDAFRACPHRDEILEGLLGNDLLGFHTPRYRANFLGCVDAALDDVTVDWGSWEVTQGERSTRVIATPMGVPHDTIHRSASAIPRDPSRSSPEYTHLVPDDAKLAIGVDRLDYTKGIPERLRALEQFWETHPDWRGELVYLQNGSESRSRIPVYRKLQQRVTGEIERINSRFRTDDWQPIVYTTERLSRENLYSLYRNADIAIVSPIRDGFNLVAQEYVAAQTDDDGVLVLSDQAGVHDEFGEHAVTVTPADTEAFADAIHEAVRMPRVERQQRMGRLRQWVVANDLDRWLEDNFRAAMKRHRLRPSSKSKK